MQLLPRIYIYRKRVRASQEIQDKIEKYCTGPKGKGPAMPGSWASDRDFVKPAIDLIFLIKIWSANLGRHLTSYDN